MSTQFDEQSFAEDPMSIHPSPSLLAFGILLLEIELGHPLEITEVDLKDGKFKNANSELTAAMRAFHQSTDEIIMIIEGQFGRVLNRSSFFLGKLGKKVMWTIKRLVKVSMLFF